MKEALKKEVLEELEDLKLRLNKLKDPLLSTTLNYQFGIENIFNSIYFSFHGETYNYFNNQKTRENILNNIDRLRDYLKELEDREDSSRHLVKSVKEFKKSLSSFEKTLKQFYC